MPELPDVMIYVEALSKRVVTRRLKSVRVRSPFVVRTFEPALESLEGRAVSGVSRLGKRVVLSFEGDLHLVIHLMIAGRLRWFDGEPRGVGKIGLAELAFDDNPSSDHPAGTLVLTEASTQKRASLHLLQGRESLDTLNPGGLEVLDATPAQFAARLHLENHTLKRALTDPRLFSGIGNAYSDEILHAARMSPVTLTQRLSDQAASSLHTAVIETLTRWQHTLRVEFELDKGPGRFPGAGDITAFRPDFSVHGKFGQPCPRCGDPVRRIVYASNECNYCATCQTGGKVLADRSLSRLLKEDWQKEME